MVNSVGLPLQPVIYAPVQPITPVTSATPQAVAREQTGKTPAPTPAETLVVRATAQAAGRQGGLGPLMADLSRAAAAAELPPAIRAAAGRVLDLQTVLRPGLSAAEMKRAVSQSGLFLEARVAAAPSTPPGPDLKASLLVLRQLLAAATPQAFAQPPAARGADVPPPPYRGAPVRAQRPAAATLPTGAPAGAVTARLLEETDAAVAREELLQLASLPEAPSADSPEGSAPPARWMLEIPFATQQGPAVAQFEISRDGAGPGAALGAAPSWRVRFSLDLEPLGPVHAALCLGGDQLAVMLWAERPQSADLLRGRVQDLGAALRPVAEHADIAVYPGAPPQAAPSPGRLVDQAS